MNLRRLVVRASAVAAALLLYVAATDPIGSAEAAPQQAGPIYEIRNYHFNPDLFDEYSEVARGAYLTYLREHLDVVGFWINTDIPSEVRGVPQDELGSANITWIIRWNSKEERDAKLPEVLGTPEWQEIFAEVPGGGASYGVAALDHVLVEHRPVRQG